MYEMSVSRKEVGRAGTRLVNQFIENDNTDRSYEPADMQIVNEWRMLHFIPLSKIELYLKREALIINSNVLVSSRIKRFTSIVDKLHRYPDMKLNKMQDLGGCRAILSNIGEVYALKNRIQKLKFKHKLIKTNDYITLMKDSGYRSLHMVYSFKNNKYDELDGLKIEIQIRTVIQHSWATAVELVGLFRNESLKSSIGDRRWLRFFQLVSELFYKIEMRQSIGSYNIISNELKELSNELNAIDVLDSYNSAAKHIDVECYKSGFCIIVVDTKENSTIIKRFDIQNISEASKYYLELESYCAKHKECEVALVSVASVNNLKNAYPAYFLETKTFINNLRRFIF